MDHYSVPAAQVLYIVELVRRWQVTAEQLLAGSGVPPDAIADPAARIPISMLTCVLERARLLTAQPALGVYLGLQMRVSMHRYLGFAALSAPTMREAIELAVRYMPIMNTAVGLHLVVDGREASILLDEAADFGSARDIVLLGLLIGLWRIGEASTGREMRDGWFELMIPEPPYARTHLERFAGHLRFAQPANRVVFDAQLLDLSYRMADPIAVRLAEEQCERELSSLGLNDRLGVRVRALLAQPMGGFHSLEQVASMVRCSPSTLKRQLAAEGLTFSQIVDDERRQVALLLLRGRELSIEQIASRLGYSDVANFARAFRRWTGTTPADYRRHGVVRAG